MNKIIFLPDDPSVWELYSKGQVHYRFNTKPYEAYEKDSYEHRLTRLCMIIVSENNLIIGLEYIHGLSIGPVVILIETEEDNPKLLSYCKRNNIPIENNTVLAELIYKKTGIDEIIPVNTWNDVARLLIRLNTKSETVIRAIQ